MVTWRGCILASVALIGGGIGGSRQPSRCTTLASLTESTNRAWPMSRSGRALACGRTPQVFAQFGLKAELLRRGVEIKERQYFDRYGDTETRAGAHRRLTRSKQSRGTARHYCY